MDFAVSPLCFAGEDALLDWACSPGGRDSLSGSEKQFYNPSSDDRQIQTSCIRSHRQTNKEKTLAATRTEITPEPTHHNAKEHFSSVPTIGTIVLAIGMGF